MLGNLSSYSVHFFVKKSICFISNTEAQICEKKLRIF